MYLFRSYFRQALNGPNFYRIHKPILRNVRTEIDHQCQYRKTLQTHFGNSFEKNINPMIQALQYSSINLACLVLQNMRNYNTKDLKLYEAVKESIRKNITKLTPEICYELVKNMDFWIQGDEADILKGIYTYITKLYYLFAYKDLQYIEMCYFNISKLLRLNFPPLFQTFIQYQKSKLREQTRQQSKDVLCAERISVPPFLDVVYSCYDNKMVIHFRDTKQNLKIYGISNKNFPALLRMKEVLMIQRRDRQVILSMPPLASAELEHVQKMHLNEQESRVRKLLYKGLDLDLTLQKPEDDPEQMLKKYRTLSYLPNNAYTDFYIDNYLCKYVSEYKVNPSERLVYHEENYLAQPDAKQSLLYYASKLDKKKNYKFYLSSMAAMDEIYLMSTQLSTQELNRQFAYFRQLRFNGLAAWVYNVFRQGCCFCSNQDDDGPELIRGLASNDDLNQQIPLTHQVNKVLRYININNEWKDFIMFAPFGQIFDLLRIIIDTMKDDAKRKKFQSDSKQVKSTEECYQNLQDFDIVPNFDHMDPNGKDELVNKMAMLAAMHQIKRAPFPEQMSSHSDLFDKLLNEYQKLFGANSFNNIPLKLSKNDSSCYANKVIFSEPKEPASKN